MRKNRQAWFYHHVGNVPNDQEVVDILERHILNDFKLGLNILGLFGGVLIMYGEKPWAEAFPLFPSYDSSDNLLGEFKDVVWNNGWYKHEPMMQIGSQ